MTSLIELSVVTIASYSKFQNNAYIVVLEDIDKTRRLPIVIGSHEAQSIVLAMEKETTIRPMTHDLFVSFMAATKSTLQNVLIYKFSESIFYAKLSFFNDAGEHFSVEARSSDAIAIALRCGAPIFTTEEVIGVVGIPVSQLITNEDEQSEDELADDSLFSDISDEELEELLQEAIDKEDYERATLLRDEIKKREESEEA